MEFGVGFGCREPDGSHAKTVEMGGTHEGALTVPEQGGGWRLTADTTQPEGPLVLVCQRATLQLGEGRDAVAQAAGRAAAVDAAGPDHRRLPRAGGGAWIGVPLSALEAGGCILPRPNRTEENAPQVGVTSG